MNQLQQRAKVALNEILRLGFSHREVSLALEVHESTISRIRRLDVEPEIYISEKLVKALEELLLISAQRRSEEAFKLLPLELRKKLFAKLIDEQSSSSDQRSLRVFLCHSSTDKPKVRELYERLHSDGVAPWLDGKDILPGKKWRLEILEAVRASDVVIVCLSKGAITKEGYIHKEIKVALDIADEKPDGTIFIIPAKLEDCAVPESLSHWQWANLYDEDGYHRLMVSLQARAKAIGIVIPPPKGVY